MSKPKMMTIKPTKAVSTQTLNEESEVSINDSQFNELKSKVDSHTSDKNIHIDEHLRDNVSYVRKTLDTHTASDDIHVSKKEKDTWNAKESPEGAQSKANVVMNSLNLHKEDYNSHVTKKEKDSYSDKYTRAETRNLLKHSLTGLVFLKAVQDKLELNRVYPKPAFNSCVYVKSDKNTLIYNGKEWVIFNALLTPESCSEYDGLLSSDDKKKLDSIEENANFYTHPDNVDTRHVSDAQIEYWSNKAENKLANSNTDGLLSSDDKKKLDSIEDNANFYTHPEFHEPSVIKEDETHRFVTDEEKSKWDNKVEKEVLDEEVNKTLTASKSFTDTKIASLLNSTEDQLQLLRSLSFELKKDDVVKPFFDKFNECVKNDEFKDHVLNDKIHMSNSDRTLLKDVKEALNSGLNPDWSETDQSSLRFIENKPISLPANGGNADTLSGYKVEDLLCNKSFYDYTVGTSDYEKSEASIIFDEDKINDLIDSLNKGKGYSVLFRPGEYKLEKELVIKASNITITGIGEVSKLLGISIKIIGNNNIIENITLSNINDKIVNKTALYIEGDNNVIKNNTISNFDNGIIVEGSNNIISGNKLSNIRDTAIKLTSSNNANYGNIVEENNINRSDIGVSLLSTDNSLTKNHIDKNKVFNCSKGIVLSNTISNIEKTSLNIINENIVIRGKGNSADYSYNNKTIVSEFSSKNIISSNITQGKEISAVNDVLYNNIY